MQVLNNFDYCRPIAVVKCQPKIPEIDTNKIERDNDASTIDLESGNIVDSVPIGLSSNNSGTLKATIIDDHEEVSSLLCKCVLSFF